MKARPELERGPLRRSVVVYRAKGREASSPGESRGASDRKGDLRPRSPAQNVNWLYPASVLPNVETMLE